MMRRINLGKLILSFVLVVGAIVPTLNDLSSSHLFNPAWHPHARFHGALFVLFLDAMSLVVLWLLWRPSKEPDVGVKVAALFAAAAWTPFFYIEMLVPGTSLIASDDMPVLKVGGMSFAANLVVATVLLLLTVIGYWLARDSRSNA
jgi:uncharacterized protein DUF6640